MAVIFGGLFVIASILAGFTMAGGKVAALIHLSEFITIGGASIGAMIIMSPKKVLVDLIRGVLQFLKDEHAGPFTEHETIAVQIERPRRFLRRVVACR